MLKNLKQRAHKEQKVVDDAQKEANKLKDIEVKIASKTGDGDKLFGSVNNADLSAALEKAGVSIERKYITIPGNNIKRLGSYEASIRFHKDVIVPFGFDVVAEA